MGSSPLAKPDNTPADPSPEFFCPQCGYNLRGIESERCPECGFAIDRAALAQSQIPWVHRRHIGRVRAYLHTAWWVTARPQRLAAESARPVRYSDAQRFRLITVLVASLPIVVMILVSYQVAGGTGYVNLVPDESSTLMGGAQSPLPVDLILPWSAGATLWPTLPASVILLTFLVTGMMSYWFHPKKLPVVRQNRAVALSYYACAPLAFLPLPLAALGGCMLLDHIYDIGSRHFEVFTLLLMVSWPAVVVLVILFWLHTLRLLKRTVDASAGRLFAAAIFMPIGWALCAGLALLAFPWFIGFCWLTIDSFRP